MRGILYQQSPTQPHRPACLAAAALCFVLVISPAAASDHGDTPHLDQAKRADAKIADYYAFTRGDRLVLIMTVQGTIPADPAQFRFPTDVAYRFMIDRDATVTAGGPQDTQFGGVIAYPGAIKEDVVVEVRFGTGGHSLKVSGLTLGPDQGVALFAGVRDEPFIRSTRIGLNLPAIVVELPLGRVLADPARSTILTWATTDVDELGGPQDELGARAYRSMDAANHTLNTVHPSLHLSQLGLRPDVVIFDTSRPAAFPNGRDLPDDVVDLLGRPDQAPFPSTNDLPFLTQFPYLAPPHPPVAEPTP